MGVRIPIFFSQAILDVIQKCLHEETWLLKMSHGWTFAHVSSPCLDLNTRLWAALRAERCRFICCLILNCLWKDMLVWCILLQRLSHCTLW